VYFEVPFHADLEIGAREEMEIGDVAFWPDGTDGDILWAHACKHGTQTQSL